MHLSLFFYYLTEFATPGEVHPHFYTPSMTGGVLYCSFTFTVNIMCFHDFAVLL